MARVMRRQVLSMRGEPVDFGALAARNPDQITLGNTRMNARGDILGEHGMVLKTQEQIESEWARKTEMARRVQQTTSIKDMAIGDLAAAPPAKNAPEADIKFPTIADLVENGNISTTPSKRKIVDTDE